MPWLVLILSGGLEAVWATALSRSDGLRHPLPAGIFFVSMSLSMLGLGYAMRFLPVGTAYAVWTGIGACLTVGYAVITGAETLSVLKALFLLMIVGGVVGLKSVH